MQTCKSRAMPWVWPTADGISDGSTPDAIAKQILAIAPILKGQQASQQSDTPQKGQQPQKPQRPEQPQQSQQSQEPQQPSGDPSDLIDFGQATTQAPQNAPLQKPAQQQPMPYTYNSGPGLQAPLQPELGGPIVRRDTNTSAVDEFVDAQEP